MAQRHSPNPRPADAGFTLVELSIVLVVIGLIIGGVLKGQEMINSARIKSTIAQVQAYQAAHVNFKDQFGGMPGDLLNANASLGAPIGITWTDCTGANSRCDGDSVVEGFSTVESLLYWQHLAAAGHITGIELAASPARSYGAGLPAAPVGGGFNVWRGTINNRLSHWLLLAEVPGGSGGPLDAPQLAQLDKRYDDGHPGQGWIRAYGASCATNMSGSNPSNTSEYNATGINCRAAFEIE